MKKAKVTTNSRSLEKIAGESVRDLNAEEIFVRSKITS